MENMRGPEKHVEKDTLKQRTSQAISGPQVKPLSRGLWDSVVLWVSDSVEGIDENTKSVVSVTRPRTLPPKPVEEEKKHLQQHEEMLRQFRDRKDREKLERKKQKQRAREKIILESSKKWHNEILPNWKKSAKLPSTIKLWWMGIPPSARGDVWVKAIGNKCNITKAQFESYLRQAVQVKNENSMKIAAEEKESHELITFEEAGTIIEGAKLEKDTDPKEKNGNTSTSANTKTNSDPTNTNLSTDTSKNTTTTNTDTTNISTTDTEVETKNKTSSTQDNPTDSNTSFAEEAPEYTLEDILIEGANPTTTTTNIERREYTLEERLDEMALTNEASDGDATSSLCFSRGASPTPPRTLDPFAASTRINKDIVSLIDLDLPRTFPLLAFFQVGGTFHENLRRVLEGFVYFRPEIGYVQGMSYIAATLLLYMDEYTAFQCLCNLLNSPLLTAFYSMNVLKIGVYIRTFDSLLAVYLPQVHNHFTDLGITSQFFFIDWALTLFTKSLPIDIAAHVVDLYLLKGVGFLFRTGIGVLKVLQGSILNLDFEGIMMTLQALPEQGLTDKNLFKAIKEMEWSTTYFHDTFKKQRKVK